MVVHSSQIGSILKDVENNTQNISEIELLHFYAFSFGTVDSCSLYNSSGIMQSCLSKPLCCYCKAPLSHGAYTNDAGLRPACSVSAIYHSFLPPVNFLSNKRGRNQLYRPTPPINNIISKYILSHV